MVVDLTLCPFSFSINPVTYSDDKHDDEEDDRACDLCSETEEKEINQSARIYSIWALVQMEFHLVQS